MANTWVASRFDPLAEYFSESFFLDLKDLERMEEPTKKISRTTAHLIPPSPKMMIHTPKEAKAPSRLNQPICQPMMTAISASSPPRSNCNVSTKNKSIYKTIMNRAISNSTGVTAAAVHNTYETI